MSITAAPAAGAAAPKTGESTPPAEVKTVPADIRRRVLGMKAPPPETTEAKAAREKAEAEKKVADEKAILDKKAAEEAAARAGGGETGATIEKVKKVKSGPPLPERAAAAAAPDSRTVTQIVREVMAEGAPAKGATPAIDPELQREIDLAAFAEKKNPERYVGMTEKVKTFYAWNADHVAAKAKELGGGERSPELREYLDSDEYKALASQNRPSYVRGDRGKLAEDMLAERALAEARKELAPEFKKLERKTAELEHAPTIKAKTNHALTVIITDPSEQKDPALEGFARDPIKFGEEHPAEAQIIAAEASTAINLIEEVYRIDHDLVDFNPKAPTPKQAQIRQFVRGQNESLRGQYPNGMEMKDGTILIDADTFSQKELHKDARYRVFTADEIAGMIAATANTTVLEELKKQRVGITKSVYAPKTEGAAPPPGSPKTPTEEEPAAPAAGSRAAPGTAVKAKDQKSLARRYA